MASEGVGQLLYLLDQAFEGDRWHSLLGNLQSVTLDDWGWLPPGGDRSIRDIVDHVGACKLMYENHAFGDATLRWEDVEAGAGGAWKPWMRPSRGCAAVSGSFGRALPP